MNKYKEQFDNYTSEVLLEKRALGDELDAEAHKAIEEIFAERNEYLPAIPSKPIIVNDFKTKKAGKLDIVLSISLMLGAMVIAKMVEKNMDGCGAGTYFWCSLNLQMVKISIA